MTETCEDTPRGRQCLVYEKPGSWERRPANFDEWYPRPPEPCPEPEPHHEPAILVALIVMGLAVSIYFFVKLLNLA
jgi:hypothetical protein